MQRPVAFSGSAFPRWLCCLLLFLVLVVAVAVAAEKEHFSCRRREQLVHDIVSQMTKDPATVPSGIQNLMELDSTTVVWRAGIIKSFVLASLAALLASFCSSSWVVFFGVLFASLCVSYLHSGHERTHVSGPIHAALRTGIRLQGGERPEHVAPRQL